MAPELFDCKKFTPKADVWALGIVLFEMCQLKRPFESLLAICNRPPEEIADRENRDEIMEIINLCLSK